MRGVDDIRRRVLVLPVAPGYHWLDLSAGIPVQYMLEKLKSWAEKKIAGPKGL